jgi:ribose transport system ATP-binding protein
VELRQPHPPSALVVANVSKTFGGNVVLHRLDLTVRRGEIHAMLGENGSGKSTFIKILAGYHRPDPGAEVLVCGRRLTFGSAASSHSLGCRFVHQDLGLVETATILDNFYLAGGYPLRWGTIRARAARSGVQKALARVGLDPDPRSIVGELSPAMRTGVAMARALDTGDRAGTSVLVLDEPTATLPASEVRRLIDLVKAVAASGVGVLFVTHRLDDVFQLADTATVLRDGRRVSTQPVSLFDRRTLVNLLVGEEFDEVRVQSSGAERGANTMLDVRGLTSEHLHGVGFTVRSGEITGVAGLTGSGRESLLGALFGAVPRSAGTVRAGDETVPPMRPDRSIGAGMAFLPPDRRGQSGIMDLSASANLTLPHLSPFWRWPRLSSRLEATEVRHWFDRLGVRPAQAGEDKLSTFSGGNQQKVLFGKWLRLEPRVLLLDEPTQGVDVGAKADLYREIIRAAATGTAILLSSSDVDELVAICHRVLVLRDGRIVERLSGSDITVSNISHASFGTAREEVA